MSNIPEEFPTEREYTIRTELTYLKFLYLYVFKKKNLHLVEFLLFHFFVGFIPLFIVMFKIRSYSSCVQKSFWGDGTLIIYCFTIICSIAYNYFTNSINNKNNPSKSVIWVGVITYLIITTIVYIDAQLNFNRSWKDIYIINIVSMLLFLIGCLASLGIHFSSKYSYGDIMIFKKEELIKEDGKKISHKNQSGGTKL